VPLITQKTLHRTAPSLVAIRVDISRLWPGVMEDTSTSFSSRMIPALYFATLTLV